MILRTLRGKVEQRQDFAFSKGRPIQDGPLFCPEAHPHHRPPLPKPQARRKPLCCSPSPPPLGFPPPAPFPTVPARLLPESDHGFFSAFFFPASLIDCQATALEGLCLREGTTDSFH